MQERRIYQRSPIELAASYGIDDDLPETQEATVINISSGGFCFYSKKPISEGSELYLSVDLDNHEQATIKVRVAWDKRVGDTGNYMIGVQVTEAEGVDFDKFIEFYAKLVKENSQEVS